MANPTGTNGQPAKKRPRLSSQQMMLRVTQAELDAWDSAARALGRTRSGWLKWIANNACGHDPRQLALADARR
jgi:hypothetical protein